MRTLAEYAQRNKQAPDEQREKAEGEQTAEVAARHDESRRLRLKRLSEEWNPQVRSLLDRAGQILWPREEQGWPWRWLERYRVVSDRHNLRWQLLRRGRRTYDDGAYEHVYALGYEVRLAENGFDLTVGDEDIVSPFDLADLEDALVRLLECQPEGCEILISTSPYHRWFTGPSGHSTSNAGSGQSVQ